MKSLCEVTLEEILNYKKAYEAFEDLLLEKIGMGNADFSVLNIEVVDIKPGSCLIFEVELIP